MNFVYEIEQEVRQQLHKLRHNTKGKVWKIPPPTIRRPTSICEITGITA